MYLPIIKSRKIWFTFSSLLVGISIVSLVMYGLNMGIDFTGGTLMEFKSNQVTNVQDLNQTLKDFTEISTFKNQPSGDEAYLMRFQYIDNETHVALISFLQSKYSDFEEMRYETIGPIIGSDLQKKAIFALGLAILFIIMFVAFAFRKIPKSMSSWKFGVTAVVALVHDVMITIGVFSLLGHFMNVEIDSLFVTALLTVMGFSVHDTIVVFDRIREHIIKDRRKTFAEAAEISVNETMIRSINTSLTTLFTLMALFLLAGNSIRYFVLALIIGIFVGTYSSIFLASPFLVIWQSKSERQIESSGIKTLGRESNDIEDFDVISKNKKRKKQSKKRR